MNDINDDVFFSYQLKNNIEKLLDFINKMPNVIPSEIKENANYAFRELNTTINQTTKLLEAHQKELNKFSQRACELCDEAYEDIHKSNKSMHDKLEKLSCLPEIKCHIPYNFKEMIDISKRLGSLSDKQFDRVIDLAKAFSDN